MTFCWTCPEENCAYKTETNDRSAPICDAGHISGTPSVMRRDYRAEAVNVRMA